MPKDHPPLRHQAVLQTAKRPARFGEFYKEGQYRAFFTSVGQLFHHFCNRRTDWPSYWPKLRDPFLPFTALNVAANARSE